MLNIRLAQLNFHVGNISANCEKIIQAIHQAKKDQCDVIVFPELALTGYLPRDLLLRDDFLTAIELAIETITSVTDNILVVLGAPVQQESLLYNAAIILQNQKIIHHYYKECLPNYGVFDEPRYFVADRNPFIFPYKNNKLSIIVCEDIWHPMPIQRAKDAGAEAIIVINASPFDYTKHEKRLALLKERNLETGLAIAYLNLVGGQDDIVFDGGSFAINQQGNCIAQASFFEEDLLDIKLSERQFSSDKLLSIPGQDELVYKGLVLATRDYIHKNKFNGALLGLSGGIDSALTLAIAVDAIGAKKVHAVMMPSRYTADMSVNDAAIQAEQMGVHYSVLNIEPIFNSFLDTLAPEFAGKKIDTTEENLQARCRGTLLMALSNKTGKLVLTTSNKSESAVGYGTLYGDMAGGFAVIKDVAKMWVYRLAKYRNTLSPTIPPRVIDRPPSAELAPNQTDQDNLPPYPILDAIIERFVEQDESIETIIKAGFDRDIVIKVITLIERNEYKRRQSPLGPKISPRAFGIERRYPTTNGFNYLSL